MRAGWEVKKLGDVCGFDKFQAIHKNLPYVGLENIESNTASFLGSLDSQSVKSATFRFTCNHILYGRLRPYLNKVLAPEFEGHCSTEIFPIKPNTSLLREYLLYWFLREQTVEQINATCTGARMPRADMSAVLNFDFLLPPFAEQQRIVAILDQAFEGIAKARTNAEQNLQNARALFESHLQSVFTQCGEGWIQNKLAAFTITISTGPFGSLLHKSDYVSEGVPLVNPINIVNNSIIPNESKQINVATKARLQSYVLKESDIVIGRRGEIGRCAVVSEKESGWICGTGCFFIRPLPTTNPHFLANLIRSGNYREKLEQASSGATMLNLSNKALCDLEIAMPSFEEQKNILQKLDALSKETKRLEALYQRKIECLDELKKSLLQQAFAGEL